MEGNVVLISIHPEYVEKIISGEKKLEFRRRWAVKPVDSILIYATSPLRRLVAIAQVVEVHHGGKNCLWKLAKIKGGGITREKLFKYMDGREEGIAIELSQVKPFAEAMNPDVLFGKDFHPPQSFRYLKKTELVKLKKLREK